MSGLPIHFFPSVEKQALAVLVQHLSSPECLSYSVYEAATDASTTVGTGLDPPASEPEDVRCAVSLAGPESDLGWPSKAAASV